MTAGQYAAFCDYRAQMKRYCAEWSTHAEELCSLQKEAALKDTPPYPLETPVVYNTDYDAVSQESDIRLLVIGDNPGKEEQLLSNRRYLVGQSGRIADGFFRRNAELGIDFRKNVIILNKTPVHTAKTTHLKYLSFHGSKALQDLLLESQLCMARLTAQLHQSLGDVELWLVGYSELKGRGIFLPYRDELLRCYQNDDKSQKKSWNSVYVFQHFSMNRFLIDLSQHRAEEPLNEALHRIGTGHRKEIFLL